MLKLIEVKNYRNLNLKVNIPKGRTIVYGDNGQGKTNLLEAIYLLSSGKPFRGSKEEIIRWKETEAFIRGETENDLIEVSISKERETRVYLNKKLKGLLSLIGRFQAVLFHPEDIAIITGPPTVRRAWLDRLCSSISKTYLFDLLMYLKALKNKNRLLKTRQFDQTQIEVWNITLSDYGTKIWLERKRIMEEINTAMKSLSENITGKRNEIFYQIPLERKSKEEMQKDYLAALGKQKGIEQRLLITVFGPHRDEFKVVVEETKNKSIVEKDLAAFGSRAEQRQSVIFLKLSEEKLIRKFFHKAPTLLLDDVFSELDKKNKELFLQKLKTSQTIITTASLDLLPPSLRKDSVLLEINEGTLQGPTASLSTARVRLERPGHG